MRIYYIILLATTLLLGGCDKVGQHTETADVIVSIEPLKYLVEQIVGNDLTIDVLTPAGTSPETYEPTPQDMNSINHAKMIFSTGLIEFETTLLGKIADKERVVNLSHGIELIEGSCSHSHDHSHAGHHHGIDPHIWTSPAELRTMARNAHAAIIHHYPDSMKYTAAYEALDEELKALDEECRTALESAEVKAFVIYHPALTYYARAYALEQIAFESEGKEPSAKHIAEIIRKAKELQAQALLYQTEFPRSVVEVVAKDMALEPKEINPLSENPTEFIREVTRTITGK
ncbi:MAG: zinc ABC transporter substrate-binding protein [Alistipes sp.]|nr:zinc ABC transporter substrate-binding protein [Alistipes sp.]